MKGVILTRAPAARIIDLSHAIPPQDIVAGAYALRSATPYFPPGTIHVAVVDPGVGTRRRALLVETRDAFLIGPDNGLLGLAAPARQVVRTFDVSRSPVRRRPVSRTFHGRDVFAPVAAALANGAVPADLGTPTAPMQRLRLSAPSRRGPTIVGRVLWIDHFGNVITNIARTHLDHTAFRGRRVSVRIGDHVLRLRSSYTSGPAGKPLALVNSLDLIEIALPHGSAAATLGIERGARVVVEAPEAT